MVAVRLSPNSMADYQRFLRIKSLPRYSFTGTLAEFPDEYASIIGVKAESLTLSEYEPSQFLYDFQRAIATTAIRKQKYAVFADCGLGKTAIALEYARHVLNNIGDKKCLIIAPLMVVRQTLSECKKFYGDTLPLERVRAADLQSWLNCECGQFGITNYDALSGNDDYKAGKLAALILDESSMLKSHYGRWGQRCLDLGKGLHWKLCLTGTPAPNDRIEYANHAVFLDQFPTVNAFLARYFVNRGQTDNRWELKPHALRPFYTALSHWCIFLSDPATYGWKGTGEVLPPIHVHITDVPLTNEQSESARGLSQSLFVDCGSFVRRGKLSQLAKGIAADGGNVPTVKFEFIRNLVGSFKGESTIIWCNYNREQDIMEETFPDAVSIRGDTSEDGRAIALEKFQSGRVRVMISKPKVLGFGLNLQIATRQVFSSLVDSYESYYQAVKRSNRIGSSKPLNVHIPITEIERPMVDNVLRKASRVQADTEEQERLFKELRDAVVA